MSSGWPSEDMRVLEMTPGNRRRRSTPHMVPVAPLGVEGLLIDFCGVMLDASPWQRWLFQLVTRMGLHAHFQTFHKVWASEYAEDVTIGRHDYWDALAAFLIASGLSHNQTEEVVAAGRAKKPQFEEAALPLPGVATTLAQLANQGLTLALFGNIPADRDELVCRLRSMRLHDHFDVIISVRELGTAPDVRSRLRQAASLLDKRPARLGVVSGEKRQLAAATSLGATTIAVNYDSDAQANVYLDQFSHLLHIIPSVDSRRLAS